jgi:hypothetical protein
MTSTASADPVSACRQPGADHPSTAANGPQRG